MENKNYMNYRQHITLLFSGPPHHECKHEKPTLVLMLLVLSHILPHISCKIVS